ncbi:MAG: DUF1801 domain-containing protein [Phycisphaerales bacterium]
MQSKAATVPEYLASLPEDRRATIEAVRAVILKNIDKGFEERMGYGMMGYAVPHSIFPAGYHCDPSQPLPFAGLASQKQGVSLHLMGLYMNPSMKQWFVTAWKATGKKLDMGASCIRFKKIDDVPLDVVAEALRRMKLKDYVAMYEAQLAKGGQARASKPAAKSVAKNAAKKSAKKAGTKKKVAKRSAVKKKR